jgi:hypothetical protein
MKTFYVYLYMREDLYSPYYVGKGSGKRAYQNGGRNCHRPEDDRIRIVYETTDEDKALDVEETLIRFYGRKCDGGVLQNVSVGGKNPPSHKGKKWSAERRQEASERAKKDGRINRCYGGGGKKGNRNSMGHARPVVLDGVSYESVSAAARALGTSRQNIQNWLSGTKRRK